MARSTRYGTGVSLPQPPGPAAAVVEAEQVFGLPVETSPKPRPKETQDFAVDFGTVAEPSPARPRLQPAAEEPNFGVAAEPSSARPRPQAATEEPNFGLPVQELPQRSPRPQVEPPPQPAPGMEVQLPAPQTITTKAVPLTLGYLTKPSPPDLPGGASPTAQNWLVRDGGIEPRYRLAQLGTDSSTLVKDAGLWVGEYSTTTGIRTPVAISSKTLAWLSGGTQWLTSSFSTRPVNDPPTGPNTDYVDAQVIYHPTPDENVLVFCQGNNQAFCWSGPQSSSSNSFSALTNAPIAKYVCAFDSRVVFGWIKSGGTIFPQRVMWSDRGAPETYAVPNGGFEDLMDARGTIQRIVEDSDRILIFFDFEIWQAFKADWPFNMQFVPLDRTIGTLSPFSVVKTPKGYAFFGSDYQVYLIPKGGTPVAVSDNVWLSIRDEVDTPSRAYAVYEPRLGEYQLYYPTAGGSGRPTHSRHINLADGTWMPHTHAHDLDALGLTQISSSASTFGGMPNTFLLNPEPYNSLGGVLGPRTVLAVTSSGTVGQFTSTATGDLGSAVLSNYLAHLGNPTPNRRLLLKELWMDYQAASASSVTINTSADFGQSIANSYAVALPPANPSGQTVIQVQLSAVYPTIQFQHDQGSRFKIQRVLSILEDAGRG